MAVCTSAFGQFFLKLGALKLGRVDAGNFVSHVLSIVLTPELILGLGCYGLGAMFYILLLTRVELSVAAPAASLMYVISVFLGYFVFKEPVPLMRAVGLGFIVTGVIFLAWQK
jgi:drug/metabolite transporter (DMT)-like permease